nr:MAG TPA: hypothetical protein [Caudoviricetes sp.]
MSKAPFDQQRPEGAFFLCGFQKRFRNPKI